MLTYLSAQCLFKPGDKERIVSVILTDIQQIITETNTAKHRGWMNNNEDGKWVF